MSNSGEILHGGALIAAQAAFPDAPRPWLDLSTGINAIAYPVADIAPNAWTRLPEREEIEALQTEAAKAFGSADGRNMAAAPGTQALLQVLPRVFPARRVAVLGYTYGEHARCWSASGADVRVISHLDEAAPADVVVVVNPNNPDGRLVSVDALAIAVRALSERGGCLIVDEAFVDVLPKDASFVPRAAAHNAIVLRSFGKAYGLAGLRLGFAIASENIASKIRDALGPWAVSGPAVALGIRALQDSAWLRDTRNRLQKDAARMDALLLNEGFAIVGGTPLFRLAANDDAPRIYKKLCAEGILARAFPDRQSWLRFGLPGVEQDWARLKAALRSIQ